MVAGVSYGQAPIYTDSLQLQLSRSKGFEEQTKILWEIADVYRQSNFKKSLEYASKSLETAKKTQDHELMAKSYKKIGDILFKAGLYQRAVENFLKSKSLFEEYKLGRPLIGVTHNIGGVYYRLLDYEQALEYFNESLGLCFDLQNAGDTLLNHQLHTIYNSIGSLYGEKGENKTAVSYFEKALATALKQKDYRQLGVIYNNLGKQAQILGNNDAALDYLHLSLQSREKINDEHGIAKSYLFISEYYWQLGELEKALESSEKALLYAQRVGGLFELRGAYSMLYEVNKAMQNNVEALDAHEFYFLYTDSLFNESAVSNITKLQMEYEYNKKEKDRLEEAQRVRMVYYFVLVLLLLALVIVALLYALLKIRSRKNLLAKENLEKNLEIKDKELATNVLYLIKKNELISGISNRLMDLKANLKSENKEPLQQIIFDLTLNMDKDVWEEFEMRFQQIHSEFYKNLQEKYPDLTPSEKKLAAFLRLNMTTKDIASITGQSPRSLEVARYRLRKKLGIESREINLINFLSSI